jgi:hypothetical protein
MLAAPDETAALLEAMAPRITITGFVFCGSVEVQRAESGRAYAPLTG